MSARTAAATPSRTGDLLVALGACSLCVAVALDPASVGDGPILCPLRALTGIPCPGCGLTRSFVHLAHGDLPAALAANLFGPVLFVLVALFVLWRLASLLPAPRAVPAPDVVSFVASRFVLAGLVVPWLAWGVTRMVGTAIS